MPTDLKTAFEKARYAIEPAQGGHHAENAANRFAVSFVGAETIIDTGKGASAKLHVAGYGWGDDSGALQPMGSVTHLEQSGQRLEQTYSAGALSEWFENTPRGLEQGFVLARRERSTSGPLRIQLAASGEWHVKQSDAGVQLTHGAATLNYAGLKAWDAKGTSLTSHLRATDFNSFEIAVDDAHAVYPVTVDPTYTQYQILTASDASSTSGFGNSVVLSSDGSTALIGSPGSSPNSGAAYVFTRSASGWTQQQKLTPSDGVLYDNFGGSVALSSDGDTALIGAPGANNDLGAAYVFTRSAGVWAQQQELTESKPYYGDGFGYAVALSGDGRTALVSAHAYGSASVVVFAGPPGGWIQQQVIPGIPDVTSSFGSSVALSADGSTALIGDETSLSTAGRAFLYTHSTSGWDLLQTLLPSTLFSGEFFGTSLALSGDGSAAIVGTHEGYAAYVFTRSANGYIGQQLKPSDSVGNKLWAYVAISGDGNTAVATGYDQNSATGGAYVFSRSPTGYAQQLELTANFDGSGDGAPVALSSDASTVLVGGSYSQGVAYAFALPTLPGLSAFLGSNTPGPLRNNYSGFVGMQFTVGSTPVTVYSLGRFVVSGNTKTHVLKLVQANGADVPGGSVTIPTSGAISSNYEYNDLASPITLQANTSYFLVSQETAGGDQWYDYGSVTTASIGTVNGPVYTDGSGHYVALTGLPGQSYVPVNMLFAAAATTSLSVTITSPPANATISGTASLSVNASGPVTGLQVQVDGVNQGSLVPVSANNGPTYALSLDTTVLSAGTHSLTVVASDAANDQVTSLAVSVTVSNPLENQGGNPLVMSFTPGPLRNNYSGFVGMSLTVGSTPMTVSSLGRIMVGGNSGTHLLKLVSAGGTVVPGGSVTITMSSATTPGTFQYAALAAPVTLAANTSFFLLSQETAGGDQWYDIGAVTTTTAAAVAGPTYTDGNGNDVLVSGLAGQSYVPVNLLYGSASPTPPPPSSTLTAFTTSQTASSLRNNYGGFVGMQINVGASPITVVTLGRYVVSGNNGMHVLKLVNANGSDVTNGSVTVNLSGAAAGGYAYAAMVAPVTLAANTTYYLVSQETVGGDMWYNLEPITVSGVAVVGGPTYVDGQGHYVTVGGLPGYSYVPLSFQYQ